MATAFGIRCVHNIVDINRPALMREEKKISLRVHFGKIYYQVMRIWFCAAARRGFYRFGLLHEICYQSAGGGRKHRHTNAKTVEHT